METVTLWGQINADGSIASSGGGFKVFPQQNQPGVYLITFQTSFTTLPAIVGTQTMFGNVAESNTDGIVFPVVSTDGAYAKTGDGSGNAQNRSFSFIAIGYPGSSNPKFK